MRSCIILASLITMVGCSRPCGVVNNYYYGNQDGDTDATETEDTDVVDTDTEDTDIEDTDVADTGDTDVVDTGDTDTAIRTTTRK